MLFLGAGKSDKLAGLETGEGMECKGLGPLGVGATTGSVFCTTGSAFTTGVFSTGVDLVGATVESNVSSHSFKFDLTFGVQFSLALAQPHVVFLVLCIQLEGSLKILLGNLEFLLLERSKAEFELLYAIKYIPFAVKGLSTLGVELQGSHGVRHAGLHCELQLHFLIPYQQSSSGDSGKKSA